MITLTKTEAVVTRDQVVINVYLKNKAISLSVGPDLEILSLAPGVYNFAAPKSQYERITVIEGEIQACALNIGVADVTNGQSFIVRPKEDYFGITCKKPAVISWSHKKDQCLTWGVSKR